HSMGFANNTNNQAFISKLQATRKGIETGRRAELITTVNDLPFDRIKGPTPSGGNFTTSGLSGLCGDNEADLPGAASSSELARGFVFGAGTSGNVFQLPGVETLTLTGLTPGRPYVLSLFSVGAGDPGGHWQTVTVGSESFRFDQNAYGRRKGIRIDCEYVANSSGQATITIVPDNPRYAFHFCGFANRSKGLRQWINFPRLPDVVAGQSSPLAVGNYPAINASDPLSLQTGNWALCSVDGELLGRDGGLNVDRSGWDVGVTFPGLGTGQPLFLSSSDTNVAVIGAAITNRVAGNPAGFWVIPMNAGTTTITASAAGNDTYSAAEPVSLTLNVRPNANAVVTLTEPTNLV
ncbi:hypothetical protein EBZ02_10440, partial [bacterium]|nr:hypothetical protein [bacterium]